MMGQLELRAMANYCRADLKKKYFPYWFKKTALLDILLILEVGTIN